ncbi:MAG TPA: M15 family metallopeptidase [Caulobacteraceae bacterium]|nr:M15 family metallopeptidase [Caulobacteraceae bacterium]
MSTPDPHDRLAQVEPDLARLVNAAFALCPHFVIVQGLRDTAQETACVASGHSETMHSRHLPDCKGLAAAIDFAALKPDGSIDWAPGHQRTVYGLIEQAFAKASQATRVPFQWGGDWSSLPDFGHIQLPWAQYP